MTGGALSSVFAPRADRRLSWRMIAALVAAILFHFVLFGVLSLAWTTPREPVATAKPIDVSLVDEVALDQRAPRSTEAPAQSQAPEIAPPEDAAPPPAADAVQPDPAPPRPVPPKSVTAEKPDKAKPAPPRPAASAAKAVATTKATGSNPTGKRAKAAGATLGADFRAGLVQTPAKGKAVAPPAAVIDGKALADIQSAIARQIQPCANRQVIPGPGATDIITVLNLRLTRDGILSATPTMVRQAGIDDTNERYSRRVIDLGIAALRGCSPLRLPAEYYATAKGGWNNINFTWQLGNH